MALSGKSCLKISFSSFSVKDSSFVSDNLSTDYAEEGGGDRVLG